MSVAVAREQYGARDVGVHLVRPPIVGLGVVRRGGQEIGEAPRTSTMENATRLEACRLPLALSGDSMGHADDAARVREAGSRSVEP